MPRLVVRPLERFLEQETGSAGLLMAAAVAALVWANVSPASYDDVWTTEVTLKVGGWRLEDDVRHVINDLLMAVFFYVIALEVKRELLFGSLRDRRSAAVPTAAAFGTMVGAALTYVAVNLIVTATCAAGRSRSRPTSRSPWAPSVWPAAERQASCARSC